MLAAFLGKLAGSFFHLLLQRLFFGDALFGGVFCGRHSYEVIGFYAAPFGVEVFGDETPVAVMR